MGSPLGPTLANAFLCYYEKRLDNCPIQFKSMIYKRYVDSILVLFLSKERLQLFVDYRNKQHRCIRFITETEHDNCFLFLEINSSRHNQGRVAKWLATCARKPKGPGLSRAASYVQKSALCSNCPANVYKSLKRAEVVERS